MPKTQEEISELNRKKGQQHQTHGIYAYADRGEEALTPSNLSYLAELKTRLATESGRLECRRDLAAALGTIVEMGFSEMQKAAGQGKDIFSGGVIKILGIYINSYIRVLDNWPKDAEKPKNILEALRGEGEDE